jgi:hypothetical protein
MITHHNVPISNLDPDSALPSISQFTSGRDEGARVRVREENCEKAYNMKKEIEQSNGMTWYGAGFRV